MIHPYTPFSFFLHIYNQVLSRNDLKESQIGAEPCFGGGGFAGTGWRIAREKKRGGPERAAAKYNNIESQIY